MNPDTGYYSKSAGNYLHQAVVRGMTDDALERAAKRHETSLASTKCALHREEQQISNIRAEQQRRAADAEHRRLAYELNHAVLDVRDAQEREAALREQLARLHR